MDSCGEYFLFYRLTDFVIFSSGLKVWLLLVQDTFRLPLPGVLALDLFAMTSVQKLIFLFPTSADGRSSHFRLRVLANHLASIFFPPLSGDSLGLLYPCIPFFTHPVTKYKHLFVSILTWICYFGIDLHYLS